MKKRTVGIISLAVYSLVIMFSAYFIGINTSDASTKETISTTYKTAKEEEYYTAKEKDGKLSLYKDGELLMSLDTNVEMLPAIVRTQLKKGVEFKPSELPGILEAFAE